MIEGQISIFEFMNTDKKCTDCAHWYFNRCTWKEMMIPSTPECIDKNKWVLGDDAKIRNGTLKEYRSEQTKKIQFKTYKGGINA